MRKITAQAVEAFESGKPFHSANTRLYPSDYGSRLYLHGSMIAEKCLGNGHDSAGLYITTCGWNTATTRERLNGLKGVRVHTKRGVLYLNGETWDGDRIKLKLH